MNNKAIIFDMDGVLIDSEPLWQKAQDICLSQYGVRVTPEECERHTMGKRIDAIAQTWKDMFHLDVDLNTLEKGILDKLCLQVMEEGRAMPGVSEMISAAKALGYQIGLATSSSRRVVNVVLDKLGLVEYFDEISSAEDEKYGKPHPAVYLTTARKLNVQPKDCLVIEDSLNGLIAAKSAMMTTYLVSHDCQAPKFAFADNRFSSMLEVVKVI
ncbi:hexitol phosphatase HxpB [Vibrio albus]|uniref:Hexitol phosphatase HxpB n=1 Tax=Vibrio albus TaxID=2200953 RepID=A0A2U3B6Q6_9VIBR|nr:hexitol phosphatase HxpB [Vibrio albus]PWI32470.1 hexitol phosphatase HxpB [Vibrio albus]